MYSEENSVNSCAEDTFNDITDCRLSSTLLSNISEEEEVIAELQKTISVKYCKVFLTTNGFVERSILKKAVTG